MISNELFTALGPADAAKEVIVEFEGSTTQYELKEIDIESDKVRIILKAEKSDYADSDSREKSKRKPGRPRKPSD